MLFFKKKGTLSDYLIKIITPIGVDFLSVGKIPCTYYHKLEDEIILAGFEV